MKLLWIGVLALVITTPALAADWFDAVFDANRPIMIKGEVTKMEWANPHVNLFVGATNPMGQIVNWRIELPSPNKLIAAGWRAGGLKAGDPVTVSGFESKSAPNVAGATTVSAGALRSSFAHIDYHHSFAQKP